MVGGVRDAFEYVQWSGPEGVSKNLVVYILAAVKLICNNFYYSCASKLIVWTKIGDFETISALYVLLDSEWCWLIILPAKLLICLVLGAVHILCDTIWAPSSLPPSPPYYRVIYGLNSRHFDTFDADLLRTKALTFVTNFTKIKEWLLQWLTTLIVKDILAMIIEW